MDPGSVSGSHLFESRLARLRLGVFEPMDIINNNVIKLFDSFEVKSKKFYKEL